MKLGSSSHSMHTRSELLTTVSIRRKSNVGHNSKEPCQLNHTYAICVNTYSSYAKRRTTKTHVSVVGVDGAAEVAISPKAGRNCDTNYKLMPLFVLLRGVIERQDTNTFPTLCFLAQPPSSPPTTTAYLRHPFLDRYCTLLYPSNSTCPSLSGHTIMVLDSEPTDPAWRLADDNGLHHPLCSGDRNVSCCPSPFSWIGLSCTIVLIPFSRAAVTRDFSPSGGTR